MAPHDETNNADSVRQAAGAAAAQTPPTHRPDLGPETAQGSVPEDEVPGWHADVLGAGYERLTLPLGTDDEGEVVATLVRAPKPSWWSTQRGVARNTDVVYIHGWSDYFFQTNLAEFWRERGARFYAIDLRKYGRSLRPGQTPGYVEDLTTYDADIEAALHEIGHGASQTSTRRLVLFGHSTGGLTLSLWAARHPGRATAMVLNSPWLELQTRELGRMAFAPMNSTLMKIGRKTPYPQIDRGFYTKSLLKQLGGEWEYNTAWRPELTFAVYPGWLDAVIKGHQTVAHKLHLTIPVYVMLSARSVIRTTWDESMRKADTVLDVEGVAARCKDLGESTTLVRLDGALHDVVLSSRPVRERAFAGLHTWLRGYLN
ncbi:alpha/beta hydrolase [Lysinibacter cavernae]|uniref:Alpha-beta hydrolase superfamily lysophospholipase n=1 Tax=Lysinibacter cavernae TaxID=1640652 RepID=A0A7X5QZZ8_9MICO|nr:alpha/beta hydrolase [Lysinibacter cavernae]NIH53053.1 alpha-beta hydrolase superfamily lysophospholipase [Lysinibacter cavernae]